MSPVNPFRSLSPASVGYMLYLAKIRIITVINEIILNYYDNGNCACVEWVGKCKNNITNLTFGFWTK